MAKLLRVGFTGHQGLTKSTARLIRSELADLLTRAGPVCGLSSLAEGSDQLFAREVVEQGGSLLTVIPCRNIEDTFQDASALSQFRELLAKSEKIVRLDYPEPSEEAFWAAGKYVVENSDRLVAVWDGQKAGGLGGTADVVAHAQELGKPVEVVWPEGSSRS